MDQNRTRRWDEIQNEGDEPVSDIDNPPTSSRRTTRKAKIVLDLLSLFITLACLGFALYRSWR